MIMNANINDEADTNTTLSSPYNPHGSDQIDTTVEPTKESVICPA